uniref:ATP synthase peripheral stalk subunit F6, mitochondrial n=1 Tax=Neogobius melanostomus TaxID=47308 RepID=A0A8C6V9R4_9GOBI
MCSVQVGVKRLVFYVQSVLASLSHNPPHAAGLLTWIFEQFVSNPRMALHRLFHLSSLLRSAVGLTLRRNIGLSAVVFNKARDLDPVQKLFLDKIRDYKVKSQAAGGIVEGGATFEKNLNEEVSKLQRLYGGGDLTKFPDFKFTDPKLDEVPK